MAKASKAKAAEAQASADVEGVEPAKVEGIDPDADGITTLPEAEPVGRDATPGEVVAAKSADVHKKSSNEHVKVFVLPPGPKPTPENGYSHEANKAATIQYMLNSGMRPTGDVRHVSTRQHDNGVSWVLTYAVPAVPTVDVEGPSEPEVVTGGEDVAVNTSGKGHSSDTRPEADRP